MTERGFGLPSGAGCGILWVRFTTPTKEWTIVMKLIVWSAVLMMSVGGGAATAQELGPGDAAPPFDLPGSDGQTHALEDYAGRTVVLAWFPKAFTGG